MSNSCANPAARKGGRGQGRHEADYGVDRRESIRRRLPEPRRAPSLALIPGAPPAADCRECGRPLISLAWGDSDIAAIRVCDTVGCPRFAAPQGYVRAPVEAAL